MSRPNSQLWRPSPSLGVLALRTLAWGGVGLAGILFLAWVRLASGLGW